MNNAANNSRRQALFADFSRRRFSLPEPYQKNSFGPPYWWSTYATVVELCFIQQTCRSPWHRSSFCVMPIPTNQTFRARQWSWPRKSYAHSRRLPNNWPSSYLCFQPSSQSDMVLDPRRFTTSVPPHWSAQAWRWLDIVLRYALWLTETETPRTYRGHLRYPTNVVIPFSWVPPAKLCQSNDRRGWPLLDCVLSQFYLWRGRWWRCANEVDPVTMKVRLLLVSPP